MPMTSNFTLYLWPFHLRKHLKDPIGLISLLSKFWSTWVDSSNSTSGNTALKVFLLIAFMSVPVSAWRTSFLSKERGVNPQPNSTMIGLSSDVPERTYMGFGWYSFGSPFSSKKSAWSAGSSIADAIFILPPEPGF